MNNEMKENSVPIPGTRFSFYKSTEAPGYLLVLTEGCRMLKSYHGDVAIYPDRISAIHRAQEMEAWEMANE